MMRLSNVYNKIKEIGIAVIAFVSGWFSSKL